MSSLKGLLSRTRDLISGSGLGARLARGGATALLIRMASVAISYVMFVVLARHMTRDAYGQFGFAFSLATFIAVVAALGQPILALRLLPAYLHDGKQLLLKGLIRDGRLAVIIGSVACGIVLFVTSRIMDAADGEDYRYVAWTGFLVAVMAIGRHQAYTLRAFGEIARALAPRDVLWRISVIACVFLFFRDSASLTAADAINLCSATLFVILVIQSYTHPETTPTSFFRRDVESDWPVWRREGLGMWAVSVVQAVGPNLSVVVLGLTLTPEQTGPFFAAIKTATLMSLPLVAGNIVGAPLIARHYHAGQIALVQKISNYMVIGITLPILLGFAIILAFGGLILSWFGPDFTGAHTALTILAVGNLVNALCGPTAFLMNMTGHHAKYLAILLYTQAVALIALPFITWYLGINGAAIAVAAGMIAWNIWVWIWARKNIGVDPTLYGVIEWMRNGRVFGGKTNGKA